MSNTGHFQLIGTTLHRHEQEGLDWRGAALPSYGSFGGYGLFSFQIEDGRLYSAARDAP